MSVDTTEADSAERQHRPRRRLTLIESYGTFSDDRLTAVAEKIRKVTARDTPQESSENLPLPIGEPIGESSTSPIEQSIEKIGSYLAHEISFSPDDQPIQAPIQAPNVAPHGSPNDSPITLLQTSAESSSTHDTSLVTENQAILYFCLQRLNGAVTSLHRLAQETGISEHTLKSCLKKLRHEGLLQYGGRRNCGGRMGFTATTLPRKLTLRGDRNKLAKKLQQIDYQALSLAETLEMLGSPTSLLPATISLMDHPMDHPIAHRLDHPMDHPIAHPTDMSCSSSNNKKLLLQDLTFEDAFRDLNPRSLEPYLNQFETTEALQTFLDMANACITAAKSGRGKPIQNPHGFLLAQLRAGYINPPEGFKSRKVRAQEIRNEHLEAELAMLRQLKEREQALQFALFETSLSEDEQHRLVQEARAQINPNLGVSPERQLAIHKDTVLQQWFTQRGKEQLS